MKLINLSGIIFGVLGGIFIIYITQVHPEITTKYKIVTLNSGTFDIGVKVIVTNDTAFALRYVRENLDSTASLQEFDARAVTFGTIDGKSPIIWMPYNTPIEVSNHELLHATINIMHWAGVPLNDTTEEVYAYEMQYLSEEFYKQINKIK